jgi:RNA polymerase sigma-32 factor
MAVLDAPQAQRANRKYFRTMMKVPLLSKEREFDLATRWREDRDERALHELINAYMRLALSVASKYRNYGLPISDLVQEGMLGLMQAAKRFDPEREVRFATYATWWIRAAVQDFVLRNWSIVRTGTTAAQKKLFFNLNRLRVQLNIPPNAPLTTEQQSLIAQQLQIAGKEVTAMSARLSHNDRSLNATVFGDNDDEWQDFLEDSRPDPEQNSFAENSRDYRNRWLGEALAALSEREQIIIRERRLAEENVTLEKLGQRLGLSKERVRQIETQALGKIRAFIALNVGDPVESGLIG